MFIQAGSERGREDRRGRERKREREREREREGGGGQTDRKNSWNSSLGPEF